MSNAGVYLTEETWSKVQLIIDSLAISHLRTEPSFEAPPNPVSNWLKVDTDLTTYDETTGDVVETNGYFYVYKGFVSLYDPLENDWDEDDQPVYIVGPNNEELSVGWRYYCTCWGENGTVASINTPVDPGDFPQDSDMNDVATVWMPLIASHCQKTVICDQDGPRTMYAQLPTLYANNDCTGETEEAEEEAETGGDG